MAHTPDNLDGFVGHSLSDVAGPGMRLALVGINPGLWSAAVDAPFARPGNRFWPALAAAGILDHVVDASAGLDPRDHELLLARGVGISNLVNRATARAQHLSRAELRAGADRVERFVAEYQPAVVAFLGVTAYRVAFDRPKAALGEQDHRIGSARVFALPSPSGLNAHATAAGLARDYGAAAEAAGIELHPSR